MPPQQSGSLAEAIARDAAGPPDDAAGRLAWAFQNDAEAQRVARELAKALLSRRSARLFPPSSALPPLF